MLLFNNFLSFIFVIPIFMRPKNIYKKFLHIIYLPKFQGRIRMALVIGFASLYINFDFFLDFHSLEVKFE